MNDSPIISLENVGYVYESGTEALKNINLNIYKSELVGIMGMNGAGKTTLIRTLNGLIMPTTGNVFIKGDNTKTKTIAQLSKDVGIIFQNPQHQLFSNSVKDEIEFSLSNLKLNKQEIHRKTNEILTTFNLRKFENRSPLNLSGGETKKLAIASIICRDPSILVFDEPTLGQDGREIKFFTDLLEKEKNAGKTLLIITHNVEFAMKYIPRIILMANGNIIADGPTRQILTRKGLTERTSLIPPQINRFCSELNKAGIKCPENLQTLDEVKDLLKKILKQAKNNQGA